MRKAEKKKGGGHSNEARDLNVRYFLLMLAILLAVVISVFWIKGVFNRGEDEYWLTSKDPTITIHKGEDVIECGFEDGVLSSDCYQHEWQVIGLDAVTTGGESRECLFVNPRDDTEIDLLFKDVVLGTTLVFSTAISEEGIGRYKSPVYLDVYIDDEFVRRVIQVDEKGWLTTEVDTSPHNKRKSDVRLSVYADQESQRYFCFNAKVSGEKTPDDYFLRNLDKATAKVDDKPCDIYQTNSVWPHNEKRAPFKDSKIFERFDCGDDLIRRKLIWMTVGRSFAVAGNEYREAIWFHPETGKLKSLAYDDINIEAEQVVGHYGLNDMSAGRSRNSEITFSVLVNGEKEFEDKFKPESGWREFSIPVDGTLEKVEFTVTTSKATWNHFFFNAYIIDDGKGG